MVKAFNWSFSLLSYMTSFLLTRRIQNFRKFLWYLLSLHVWFLDQINWRREFIEEIRIVKKHKSKIPIIMNQSTVTKTSLNYALDQFLGDNNILSVGRGLINFSLKRNLMLTILLPQRRGIKKGSLSCTIMEVITVEEIWPKMNLDLTVFTSLIEMLLWWVIFIIV